MLRENLTDLIYAKRGRVRQRRAVTKVSYFALEGGLDVSTPPLSIPPGSAISMINYEPWYEGGYRRIPGYERYDGRPKPSDATFVGFKVDDAATPTIAVGDTVTGDTSGATGELVGFWDDSEEGDLYSADYFGVTKVVGTFQNGENLNTGDFTITGPPGNLVSPNIATEESWLLVAENNYRDDIAVVPGSGPVRGAWQRLADVYAVRDNAGATAGVLHRATTSGWVTTGITMAEYIAFDNGAGAIAEGDTVTGATSGASGTVHRVILNGGSGAWDGSGEGYLVLTSVSGGPFTDTENLQVSAVTKATANGVEATFAFPVGGQYRFINHNFFGAADTYRAYGCNGVGPAFEIDENRVVSPIFLPTNTIVAGDEVPANNTPFLIEEHRNHLFLAFEGGSVQHSVTSEPLNLSGFLGAAEFALGDEVTGMNSIVGNVLILSTTRETRGLFGTSSSDWELRITAEQSGSILFASQKIDTVYSLDDLGITSVSRSDKFGDFISATVSQKVQPLVNVQRANFTDSTIVRSSNQYRLYFDDNSFIIMYVPAGSQTGSEQRRLGTTSGAQFGFGSYDIPVTLIYNTDDENGVERTYFTTDDATWQGYVFEDAIGKNFDGEEISSYVRTTFNNVKSPSVRKKFRRADLELNAPAQLDLRVQSDLTYSAAEVSSSLELLDDVSNISAIDIVGGGGFWDTDNWGEFLWDGQTITTARAELRGTGQNISLLIYNSTAKTDPFILQGITLHYDLRRLQR